jgi:hypothetical protein
VTYYVHATRRGPAVHTLDPQFFGIILASYAQEIYGALWLFLERVKDRVIHLPLFLPHFFFFRGIYSNIFLLLLCCWSFWVGRIRQNKSAISQTSNLWEEINSITRRDFLEQNVGSSRSVQRPQKDHMSFFQAFVFNSPHTKCLIFGAALRLKILQNYIFHVCLFCDISEPR